MQRFPSIMRDYRAGGAGAAPAGGSYRGNRTSGEVPQWLVDTCNEDNEYEEDYEHASHVVRHNSHDANFPVHVGAYQGSAYDSVQYGEDEYGDHSSDVSYRRASRKSSLDTVDTLRRDNTRGGTSYRQQFQDDNGTSHNFDDGDVDVGKQKSYMSEPYEYQERSQVEDEDYRSIADANGPDYYFPHHQEGTSSHRQEQAHAPQRQSFKEYQRYVMEQQQYLKSNKSGKGRFILDVVGGSVRNLLTGGMSALQIQGQSRSNLYRDDPSKRSTPPRQSAMRHRDGSLRGGRYSTQSSQRQISRPPPSSGDTSQASPPEQPEHISRQMELMMMELQGDAVPLRGGDRDRTMPQRQQSIRSVKPSQPHWDPSKSGSRFATRSPSVQSFESSLSSLPSARALRYNNDKYSKTDDQEEEYDDTTNGQELICGWSREDEDHRGNGGVRNNNSYDRGQSQRDSHPRYEMHQHYSNGPNPQPSHHEVEETDAYESFHDILPRQAEGATPRNKLLGMMKTGKQVSFRHFTNGSEQQMSSRPPLIPNGGGRPPRIKPILRRQAQDPYGRNDGTMRRQDLVGRVPVHSNTTSSLTSLTNFEIETLAEDVPKQERRVSDVTFEVPEFLEGLNGSKGSLNSSGSLSAEEITSYINNM